MICARWLGLVLLLGAVGVVGAGCGRQSAPTPRPTPPKAAPSAVSGPPNYGIRPIDLPQGEQKPGAAVVILVDTSGSMAQPVLDQAGKARPKHLIARDALDRIIDHTARWQKANPAKPLQMGLYHFSSLTASVLPMAPFDAAKARSAVAAIPAPGGGTAIGTALEEGFKALYRSGSSRKYVVCITDGENTAGPPLDRVARQLHAQTKGEVEIHCVAFDTETRYFNYLKDVNGHVVQAVDGAQLQKELTNIYDRRILVEAEDPAVK
jgi:Mg-chelatase subunit ChlD